MSNAMTATKQHLSVIDRTRAELSTYPTKSQVADVVSMIVAGCARRSDLDEGEAKLRVRLIFELLLHYPYRIVQKLADPYSGICSEHTFLPAVAEVKDFADRLVREPLNELNRAEAAQRREEEAIRERAWRTAQPPAEERASRAQAVLQKHGLKPFPAPLPRATAEEIKQWTELPPNAE